MISLNASAVKSNGCSLPFVPSLNRHRQSLSRTLSFTNSKPSFLIKASYENPNPKSNSEDPRLFKFHEAGSEVSSTPLWTSLKAALVAAIAGTAIFFSRFYFNVKPAITAPIPPAPSFQTSVEDAILDEEKEKSLEEHLVSNPQDVDALKNLMEIKIKGKKIPEAIEILEKLIELEPDEIELPIVKSHLYAASGEYELAKKGFNELIAKDPFRLEAYHGLVTLASQEESGEDLKEIETRVEEVMKLCRKQKRWSYVRDFKMITAQIKVLKSNYDDALKVYHELVKEEPRDFRPYLCLGVLYTLLRNNREAEKCFEKYKRLVPKEHPYASYFDDNMIATQVFAQKMENERAVAKS